MRYKELLRSFLGIPLTIIAFVFIGKIFYDSRQQIIDSLFSITPELFVIGILLYCLFFAIKSFIWVKILETRGHEVDRRKTLYNYSLAEIKRYIPGSIFAFIGRVDSHKTVPKKETLKGIGIEALLLVSSAIVVSIPAGYFLLSKTLPQISSFLPLLLFALFGIAAVFIYFNSKFRSIAKNYYEVFFLFILAWSVYALGSLFILLSITSIDPNSILTVASIFILSWAGGYLSFITPMGLGARELITVFSLSFFMTAPIASIVAVITRLCMILGEVVYLLLAKSIKNINRNSPLFRINPYIVIVIIMAFAYFSFFSYYSMLKHDTFLTGRFDLGNMTQTVWNTKEGRFFELTNPDGVNNISRLGVHSDIFLVAIAPLYFIWESPKMLLVFQALSVAIAGFFVYLIAKTITRNEFISTVFAASFYLNFWMHEQTLFDFHAVSIATLFLLAAFYFMLKKRVYLFLTFLLLAASTKENVFLLLSMFGIYFLIKKKWLLGTFFTVVPVIIFYLLVAVFIPQARGEAHFALGGYEYLGTSTIDIIINSIKNPLPVINQLFNFSTLYYLNSHFISTGFLAALSPLYLIFTLPDMAIYLLSENYGYRSYHYHFGALIVPFFYIASIFTVRKLNQKLNLVSYKFLAFYILFFALYSAFYYSPIPGMKNGDIAPYQVQGERTIEYYLTRIPDNADVSASNSLGAHLSHRRDIYVAPNGVGFASYIAFYKEPMEILNLVDTTQYDVLIKNEDLNFYLFKKKFALTCSSCNP